MVFLFLWLLSSLVTLNASIVDEVKFSWLPNKEANLAGYKIYSGTEPRNYDTEVDVGMGKLENGRVTAILTRRPGKIYYAATAYDDQGQESDFSEEISAEWLPSPNFRMVEKR